MAIILREANNDHLRIWVVSVYMVTDEAMETNIDLDLFYLLHEINPMDQRNRLFGHVLVTPYERDMSRFHIFAQFSIDDSLRNKDVVVWANILSMNKRPDSWRFQVNSIRNWRLITQEGMMFWDVLKIFTDVMVVYPLGE